MKKLFFLLCVVAATMLVSCEGERGPMGPPGQGMYVRTYTFTVPQSSWQLLDERTGIYFYQVTPDFYNELTAAERNDIYDFGLMMVYRYVVEGQYESQIPLPYIDNWNNSNAETQLDNYWFDFTTGDVRIYYRYSGSQEPDLRTASFRIVVNW